MSDVEDKKHNRMDSSFRRLGDNCEKKWKRQGLGALGDQCHIWEAAIGKRLQNSRTNKRTTFIVARILPSILLLLFGYEAS